MKIGDPVYRGAPVYIPHEVLSLICAHVARTQDLETQATMWACCLVCKAWYGSFIARLYQHPILHKRNFNMFANTISSGRRLSVPTDTGLQAFLEHLDMSQVAYESSRALTARLIGRAKGSLRTFTSPAVSFK